MGYPAEGLGSNGSVYYELAKKRSNAWDRMFCVLRALDSLQQV